MNLLSSMLLSELTLLKMTNFTVLLGVNHLENMFLMNLISSLIFFVMKNNSSYSVRVLHSYPLCGRETIFNNLTWEQAVEKFKFIVSACLEFSDLNVRCVNIIKGKSKSIKMFQNHE